MITYRFRFVKNFFKSFSTFSSRHSRLLRLLSAGLAADLIILPQPQAVVKHFFQVFQTFFSTQLDSLLWSFAPPGSPLPQSACLYQQKVSRLSTPFFKKIDFFIHNFFHNYICLFHPLFTTICAHSHHSVPSIPVRRENPLAERRYIWYPNNKSIPL